MVRVSSRPCARPVITCWTGTQAQAPGQGVQRIEQAGLVVLDRGENVVGALAGQVPGCLPLRMQCVQGDYGTVQVHGVQQRLDLGDLIGLVAHLPLGDDRPGAGHGSEQVHRPPVGLDGAAQRLAVHRHRRRDIAGGQPGGQPLIERASVRAGQRPADRRLTRHHPRAAARVGPYAQAVQRGLGRGGCPLGDRDQRLRPGRYRGAGQAQDRGQAVPPSLRPPVIRHPGQELRQASPRRRVVPEPGAQNMDSRAGIAGKRHDRLARHRGLPGTGMVRTT